MNALLSLPALLIAFAGLQYLPAPVSSPAATHIVSSANNTVAPGREEDAEFIPWSVRRIVSWDDFQSTPQQGTEAVASTSTSLGLSYQLKDGKLTYAITCNFSKSKSWSMMKTDYILAHEQGHFDITEISARKLSEALSTYVYNRRTYKDDLTRIYNSIVADKENMQETYDRETDHSRNRKVQQQWIERIEQQLTDTEPFAQYP